MGFSIYQEIDRAISDIKRMAKQVKELEAQLARHAWHRINPEDPGTWPEVERWPAARIKLDLYTLDEATGGEIFDSGFFNDNSMFVVLRSGKSKVFPITYYTHYRRIVGPEVGG